GRSADALIRGKQDTWWVGATCRHLTPNEVPRGRNPNMLKLLQNIIAKRDEDGASAVEYGLLVAAIAAVIVIIVFMLGGVIKDAFKNTCNAIGTNGSGSTSACDG